MAGHSEENWRGTSHLRHHLRLQILEPWASRQTLEDVPDWSVAKTAIEMQLTVTGCPTSREGMAATGGLTNERGLEKMVVPGSRGLYHFKKTLLMDNVPRKVCKLNRKNNCEEHRTPHDRSQSQTSYEREKEEDPETTNTPPLRRGPMLHTFATQRRRL